MNVKRDESKKSKKSETRKKVLFSGSFADLRLGVNEKNHEQSTISVKGLMNAFKVIYYNRERCIIEFEEIIKNLETEMETWVLCTNLRTLRRKVTSLCTTQICEFFNTSFV